MLSMITFAGRMSLTTAATLPISHPLIDMVSTERNYLRFVINLLGLDGFFGVFLEVMLDGNDTLGSEFLDFCLPIVLPRNRKGQLYE